MASGIGMRIHTRMGCLAPSAVLDFWMRGIGLVGLLDCDPGRGVGFFGELLVAGF